MFESMIFPFSLLAGYVIRSLEGKQKSLWPRPSRPTMPGEPGECGWLVVGCFLGVDIFFWCPRHFQERKISGWLVGVGFFPIFFGFFFTPEFCWGRFFTHFDVVSIFFSLGLVETTKKDLMTWGKALKTYVMLRICSKARCHQCSQRSNGVEDIERNPYIDKMQMVSQLLPKAILLNMPIVFFHDILAKWAPTKYK